MKEPNKSLNKHVNKRKEFFCVCIYTPSKKRKGREGGGKEREGENKERKGGSGNEKSPAAAASGGLRSGGNRVSVSGEVGPGMGWYEDAPRKKAPA